MYNSSKLWLVALQGDTLLGSKFEVFGTLYLLRKYLNTMHKCLKYVVFNFG